MKFKNKKFIASALTVVLLALGVPNYDALATFGAGIICSNVKCSDA